MSSVCLKPDSRNRHVIPNSVVGRDHQEITGKYVSKAQKGKNAATPLMLGNCCPCKAEEDHWACHWAPSSEVTQTLSVTDESTAPINYPPSTPTTVVTCCPVYGRICRTHAGFILHFRTYQTTVEASHSLSQVIFQERKDEWEQNYSLIEMQQQIRWFYYFNADGWSVLLMDSWTAGER